MSATIASKVSLRICCLEIGLLGFFIYRWSCTFYLNRDVIYCKRNARFLKNKYKSSWLEGFKYSETHILT